MPNTSSHHTRPRTSTTTGSAEARLQELGITLPLPPEPFGVYAEAVATGRLLFLTGMLPTEVWSPKSVGRIGAELDVEEGYRACRLAALNACYRRREIRAELPV
jgi:hypothetical protein